MTDSNHVALTIPHEHSEPRALSRSEVPAFLKQQKDEIHHDFEVDLSDVQPHRILYSPSAALTFRDVGFTIRLKQHKSKAVQEKVILAPCSGHIPPGKLVAIMGPSGCGKSTLLDILAGKKTTKYEGHVYLNGHLPDKLYPRVTSYVPQADVMFPHSLVSEAVSFTARLSRPIPKAVAKNGAARKEVEGLIQEQLEQLGLGKVASTKVGSEDVRGISGGQRRRVTLCKGIVSGAYVLFCDEPTSGLSSTDAEVAVKLMKMMTKKMGLSIFVVIHQPKAEVAALFDHLILLTSEPGRIVYNGPMAEAAAHYAKVGFPVPEGANPADFFLDLVSPSYRGQQIEAFVDYYNAKCAPCVRAEVDAAIASPGKSAYEILKERADKIEARLGPLTMPSDSVYAAPFSIQLRAVFGRQLTLLLRDRKSLRTEFVTAVVKAIIVGIGFFDIGNDDNPKFRQMPFLFMCIQMSVLSGMQSMPGLIADRNIMKWETSDRLYTEWSFLISTFILNNIVSQLANLIFIVIVFAFGNIGYDQFPGFWLWQLLVVLVTDSLFSFLAAVAKTGAQAQAMAIPPLMFVLLFNGFFITLAGVQKWMIWAIYISPMFWGLQEMSAALYADNTQSDEPRYPASGQFVIDQYGFRTDMTGVALAVILSEFVVLRTLQAFALKRFNNPEK